MNLKTKILGKIMLGIMITLLAAGFYFYLGRANKTGKTINPVPAAAQKDSGEAQNKGPDTHKSDGAIDLVRPAFLDE